MERLAIALLLLGTELVAPTSFRLPATAVACGTILVFYDARFILTMLRFLTIWLCFYAVVGMGRYVAGTELESLLVDGAAGLGLALGISCALLLVARGSPCEILGGLDWLKAPREFSYSLLSLLRLLPQVRSLGSRQLALLELKGIGRSGVRERFLAYRRIVGPLLVILLTQQSAHAMGLALRGFFDSRLPASRRAFILGRQGLVLISLLVLNAAFWRGLSLWT
jgi:energy-coupling factor transporter transmembrane protein EcfT